MATSRMTLPSLELELLRRGIGDRTRAGRRCADCHRTPLIGERLYHYEGGKLRCELCRPLRKEQPVTSELVHGPEHGHCVVRITRVAA
jgi:hypothetical protein